MFKIRQETKEDYKQIYDVVKKAFLTAEHSDFTEQDLVERLRKGKSYIQELSLVAQKDDEIVGHIMFTKVNIGNCIQLALAPLSVKPEYQRQGVGALLIKEGHRIAKNLGYDLCIVLGSDKYYPKFGYKKAELYGIKAPFDIPSENYMVYDLSGKGINISGTVKYADEF